MAVGSGCLHLTQVAGQGAGQGAGFRAVMSARVCTLKYTASFCAISVKSLTWCSRKAEPTELVVENLSSGKRSVAVFSQTSHKSVSCALTKSN